MSNILRSKKASPKVKKKVMDAYIVPVMTYGAETWAPTELQLEMLAVVQRKRERQMLGNSILDHKTNSWIREQTGIEDVSSRIKSSKHRWAGHVARFTDNRWTSRITTWTPRLHRRARGRPNLRWRDDLTRNFGVS